MKKSPRLFLKASLEHTIRTPFSVGKTKTIDFKNPTTHSVVVINTRYFPPAELRVDRVNDWSSKHNNIPTKLTSFLASRNVNTRRKMDDEIHPEEFRLVPEELDEISKKIKDLKEMLIDAADSEIKEDEANVLCSLGLAYFKLENFDLAREYQEKYLALSTELEDLKGQARAHCNIGCIYKAHGEYTKAKEQFEIAIAIGHENNNDKLLAKAYNNLANIYELQENLPEALECHQKRLAIAHKLNDRNGIGKACASLGNLYHVVGDLESSIHYYQEMLKILRDKLRK